ncbi:MAG: GNAT family N-acetyltransferase [Leptolyngbya sp. UWPOB_LEPTO1]|uniref:GNAT family N-acetyltransferase n=1 Tax=Leptolyngbya sp. UWPOB_LEPTO1 TaxID=2815653 RepID=UPI001ACA3261|nr:GNAT family N-acetyltransferase [Leptolyngbya sp. UWPOB_LEPTO1]MBN8565101.1 GNAT family N-acetyltransferase [Leptolyngbya sp. UWPOB_LEPTO1]
MGKVIGRSRLSSINTVYGLSTVKNTLLVLSGFFMQKQWQGYVTEAAAVVLNYSLHTLNLPNVNADVDVSNTVSVRVLQKLGIQQVKNACSNNCPLLYFSFPEYAKNNIRSI